MENILYKAADLLTLFLKQRRFAVTHYNWGFDGVFAEHSGMHMNRNEIKAADSFKVRQPLLPPSPHVIPSGLL